MNLQLNIKAKTVKTSEENTGVNILLIILPLIPKLSMIFLGCKLSKVNIISARGTLDIIT